MSTARAADERGVSYTVERMTEHDLLEVVNIEETCGLSLWGWDGYHADLERPDAVMLVAREQSAAPDAAGRVIGFVAARMAADELHVNNIGVREDVRRQGIGARLLGDALARGRLHSPRRAVLEVRASNRAAQSLYERHGFRVAGRRRGYYKNPPEDALLMTADFGVKA